MSPIDRNPVTAGHTNLQWAQLTRLAGDRAAILFEDLRRRVGTIAGLVEELHYDSVAQCWTPRYRLGEEVLFTAHILPAALEATVTLGAGERISLLGLRRLKLDYVDIFYSHRVDPNTPLEETMGALDTAVRQGKALYVGISSYNARRTAEAAAILRGLGTPCLIHQPSYSMLNRWIEEDHLLDRLQTEGIGCICFSPLAQGLLTDKYLAGVPADSRGASGTGSWRPGFLSEDNLAAIRGLNQIAEQRGQKLAEMAIAWVLRDARVTSALIGASRVEQLDDAIAATKSPPFTPVELAEIDRYARDGGIDIWRMSSVS